jgi:hypothetical protein
MRAANLRDTVPVVDRPISELYGNPVNHATRNDIAAAAAAHHELGRYYDDAVAESLIDRIGAEIDKRVDARLRVGSSSSGSPAEIPQSGRNQAMWTGAGIGAGITGLVAMIANSGSQSKAVIVAVVMVWVILAIAGLGTAAVRWDRGRERG